MWSALELAEMRQQIAGNAPKAKRTGTVVEVAEAEVRTAFGAEDSVRSRLAPRNALDVRFAAHWRKLVALPGEQHRATAPAGANGLGADAMAVGWSPCSCSRAHQARRAHQRVQQSV